MEPVVRAQEFFFVEDGFNGGNHVDAAVFLDEVFIDIFAKQLNRAAFDKRHRATAMEDRFEVCNVKFTDFFGVIGRGVVGVCNLVSSDVID